MGESRFVCMIIFAKYNQSEGKYVQISDVWNTLAY